MPLAGHFIDKFGIRKLMLVGSTLHSSGMGSRRNGRHVRLSSLHLLRGAHRDRRGHHLHRDRGECRQVVSRPKGPGGGADRRRIWRRGGPDTHPDFRHDQPDGLGRRHGGLGPWSGRHCHRGSSDPASSAQGLGPCGLDATESRCANERGIHLDANADEGRVLPPVRHVPHGLYRRSDDDRQPVADREVPQGIRREGPGYRHRPLHRDHRRSDECIRPDHVGRALGQVRARIHDGLCLRVRRESSSSR